MGKPDVHTSPFELPSHLRHHASAPPAIYHQHREMDDIAFELTYGKEVEKFERFLLPFWLSVGRSTQERNTFFDAVWLIFFDRFPLVHPPKDVRKCVRVLCRIKRSFAFALVVQGVANPVPPFIGDWGGRTFTPSGPHAKAQRMCLRLLATHWDLINDSGADMDLFNDVYTPYLRHVCRVFLTLSALYSKVPFAEVTSSQKPALLSSVPEAEGFDDVVDWDITSIDDKRLDLRIQTSYTFRIAKDRRVQ
ncbi:hypothetical protein ONZ45_g19659 [Pleurotus djamor]|nr:hypothetical protein ONZ45_g19659 [Pleurotus djamor]